MKFYDFINEKLADDLSTDQLDNYWKAISAFNTWKRNKKNSMKVSNMLSFILKNYPLDERASEKIHSLLTTVRKYMETGEDTTSIQKRTPKEETAPKEVKYDVSDFQKIELNDSFIYEAYKKFNAMYFNNKLPDINLKLEESNDTDGVFVFTIDWTNRKFNPLYIKLNPGIANSYSNFRSTLVHEMLHFYVHCFVDELTEEEWREAAFYYIRRKINKAFSILKCSDSTSHSGNWLKLAKQLNAKFPGLGITRNSFSDFRENKDKIKLIEQLKDAYVVDCTQTVQLSLWKSKIYHRYRICTAKQFNDFMNLVKNNTIVFTDKTEDLIDDIVSQFGVMVLNGSVYTIRASKITNPIALTIFPIGDLSNRTYVVGENMMKQMNQTNAYKPLKEIGKIKIVHENNESTDIDFKSWLNEKTNTKWDIEKLRELGLTDEEIAKLLSGEENETVSIS